MIPNNYVGINIIVDSKKKGGHSHSKTSGEGVLSDYGNDMKLIPLYNNNIKWNPFVSYRHGGK